EAAEALEVSVVDLLHVGADRFALRGRFLLGLGLLLVLLALVLLLVLLRLVLLRRLGLLLVLLRRLGLLQALGPRDRARGAEAVRDDAAEPARGRALDGGVVDGDRRLHEDGDRLVVG